MIPINPFNLKEINRKKLATPSPLRVFFVKGGVGGGGGANAAFVMRLRLQKKLWERGWFSITLYYLPNNTKHTKTHDTTPTTQTRQTRK